MTEVSHSENYRIDTINMLKQLAMIHDPKPSPLNNSYPYLKKWLSSNGYPYRSVPESPLFCDVGRKNTDRKLSRNTINVTYKHYKDLVFPKLLDDPMVLPEDKPKIKELLKKRWKPYVRRHTAPTQISKILKDLILADQYMSWSIKGMTRLKQY